MAFNLKSQVTELQTQLKESQMFVEQLQRLSKEKKEVREEVREEGGMRRAEEEEGNVWWWGEERDGLLREDP